MATRVDYSRSKQAISAEVLAQIAKNNLTNPNCELYLHEDVNVVVKHHVKFMAACAKETTRLNASTLAWIGKDLFQMGKQEAKLFGEAISHAFQHALSAGSKAITGARLTPEVWAVHQASKGELTKGAASTPQQPSTACSPAGTTAQLAIAQKRKLGKSLSSPSKIQALYAGSSFPADKKCKVGFLPCDSIEKETCLLVYYIYIYIYNSL